MNTMPNGLARIREKAAGRAVLLKYNADNAKETEIIKNLTKEEEEYFEKFYVQADIRFNQRGNLWG